MGMLQQVGTRFMDEAISVFVLASTLCL